MRSSTGLQRGCALVLLYCLFTALRFIPPVVDHLLGATILAGGLYWGLSRWRPTAPLTGVERGPTRLAPVALARLLVAGSLLLTVTLLLFGATTYTVGSSVATGAGQQSPADAPAQEIIYPVQSPTVGVTTVATAESATVVTTGRTATAITVQLQPATVTGAQPPTITIARYPATLPTPIIRGLQQTHPVAAAVGTMLPILFIQYGIFWGFTRGMPPFRLRRGAVVAWGRRRRRKRRR